MREIINTTDKKAARAIFAQFVVLTIQYFVLYFFHIEESSMGTIIRLLSKIIVGMFFLIALNGVLKKEYRLITITYGISIIISLLNVLLFPQNIDSIKSIVFDFFFICLPCFIYSFSINNFDILYKTFEKICNIVLVVGLIISLLDFSNKIDVGTYSMTLSYYLLIPSLLYLYKFLNEVSIKYFILFLISFISVLLLGARGPILCIAVYTIIYLVNSIRGKNSVKKTIIYFILIILLLTGVIFLKEILLLINNILNKYNIYSRTINLLLNEKIHLSGREYLYTGAIELIKKYPIIGIGIAGDRYYFGGYVHNLFLEILLDFGCFLGLIICFVLIIIFIKSIFFTNKKIANFTSIFFCLGVVPLMVSGSYLTDAWFWIYLGIVLKLLTNKKQCKFFEMRN
jgi:hypothetical protein